MSGPISPADERQVDAQRLTADRAWKRRCSARQRRAQVGFQRRLTPAEVTAIAQLEWQRELQTARPW
jgi:hypothetical protein